MTNEETSKTDIRPPVLLALSTFRLSDELVEHTIQGVRRLKQPLIVAFIVDVNLARYFIGTGVMVGTHLRNRCEKELLEDFRQKAETITHGIKHTAQNYGISCSSTVTVGRFGVEILKLAAEHCPSFITLTRSKRPDWVRRLFGSPVDNIIREAGCPVYEDYRDPGSDLSIRLEKSKRFGLEMR